MNNGNHNIAQSQPDKFRDFVRGWILLNKEKSAVQD